MMEQYLQMKRKAKISLENEHSDGSDFETEQDFKKLRPDAGYKLMDLLTGKVKEPKKKMLKRKVCRAPYQLADPNMEAVLMATKKPYNTQNLAMENKRKRMMRRAGFFNPVSASRNVPRSKTFVDDV